MRIALIGAGNVASHLAPALEEYGVGEVCQVYSRTQESATSLARKLVACEAITKISDLDLEADIYIVSLADNAVGQIVNEIASLFGSQTKKSTSLWLHTSGSVPMEVFSEISNRYGVLYPLQTFSKNVDVDMNIVPLFVEGNTDSTTSDILDIAKQVSTIVHLADSDLRRRMHIAAVFACNFTNYMFTVADDILKKDGLTLEVLYTLIEETFRKAMNGSPAAGQTGPAVRGDKEIVNKHASMLPQDLSELYLKLSDAIYHRHRQ